MDVRVIDRGHVKWLCFLGGVFRSCRYEAENLCGRLCGTAVLNRYFDIIVWVFCWKNKWWFAVCVKMWT